MAVDWEKIDWDLMRVEYELFGKTFDELARETGIPKGHITDVATERGWSIHPLAQEMVVQNTSALVAEAEDYEVVLEEKIKKLKLVQSEIFSPYYAKLEAALLTKAIALATSIQKDSPSATKELKDIASVMQVLLGSNGLLGKAADEGKGGNKFIVQINNGGGNSEETECTTIEVASGDNKN